MKQQMSKDSETWSSDIYSIMMWEQSRAIVLVDVCVRVCLQVALCSVPTVPGYVLNVAMGTGFEWFYRVKGGELERGGLFGK